MRDSTGREETLGRCSCSRHISCVSCLAGKALTGGNQHPWIVRGKSASLSLCLPTRRTRVLLRPRQPPSIQLFTAALQYASSKIRDISKIIERRRWSVRKLDRGCMQMTEHGITILSGRMRCRVHEHRLDWCTNSIMHHDRRSLKNHTFAGTAVIEAMGARSSTSKPPVHPTRRKLQLFLGGPSAFLWRTGDLSC